MLNSSVPFLQIYANSVEIAVIVTIGQLVTCTLAAFAFARLNFPGRDSLFFVMLVGLLFPAQVTIIPIYLGFAKVGLLNRPIGLALMYLTSSFGVFLVRQFMRSQPKALEEAALMDGAGYLKIFFRISLPQLRPALAALGIITFTQTWNYYFQARVLLEPQDSMTLPIAMDVLRGYLGSGNLALVMAAMSMSVLPVDPALPARSEDGDRGHRHERHQELSRSHGRQCSDEADARIDRREFVYRGARRQYVAFPLGGIGSGSVSLTGSGRLVDWSIRNRPAIHQHNGYSHFAIKAERDGKLIDARVLNGPYEGLPTGSPSRRKFDGFGFGANRDSMAGVPHFDDVTFVGRFPVAEIEFHRDAFPGKVRMTAFSPFIPHNERDSSMPAALFAFDVENDTDGPIDYTIAARSETMAATAACTSSPRSGP